MYIPVSEYWGMDDSFSFMSANDKRAIDDPLLNQDDNTSKDESFDDSDDFHKHDDTKNDPDVKDQEKDDRFNGEIAI